MTTQQITNELQIVKLSGQRFIVTGGYIKPSGYALHHPERGFLSFQCDGGCPYTPQGGRKALQSILDSGGLTDYSDIVWLKRL